MPVATNRYALTALKTGDSVSSLAEFRNYSTIDNILGRLASILGNGVLLGWEIEESDFPTIIVRHGSGFISKFHVTTFNDHTFELAENSTFSVYAQRRVGVISSISPRSDIATLTYGDDGPPEQPVNFSVEIDDENPYFQINLSWTPNSEIDFAKYELYRSLSETDDFELITSIHDPLISNYIDTTVDEDIQYYYRLFAIDMSGNISVPAESNAETLLSPNPPQNPSDVVFRTSENAINILWERPTSLSFVKIQKWEIDLATLNTDGTEISSSLNTYELDKNNYNTRFDSLNNGTTYKLTLYTVDTKNRRSSGISQSVVPQPSSAPRDPTNISFNESQGPSGTRVNLSWGSGDTEYDPDTSYRYNIYVQVDGQSESRAINVPIGITSEQIDLYTFNLIQYFSIPQNVLITFRITSVDQAGDESFGAYIRFVTQQFSVPSKVTSLFASFDINTGKITVNWNYTPDTTNIFITVLDEDLNGEYGNQATLVNQFIELTNLYQFDVDLDHKYTIVVTPYNSSNMAGDAEIVVKLTVIQGGLSLPQIPKNVVAKVGDRSIYLNWPSSLSLYTSSYRIYRKQGRISLTASNWTLIDEVPSSATKFVDYGLENDEVWSYYITSVDVYERESSHLVDDSINLNFVEAIPRKSGILTEPDNVQLELLGNDITIAWDSLLEEFDSFVIYRSDNNLHSWKKIATVDKTTTSYVDENIPLINNYTYYYGVEKIINDADIKVQLSSTDIPDNSILIGIVKTISDSFDYIDISDQRIVLNALATLQENSEKYIIPHRHRELEFFDSFRVDLSPELIVTDWSTVDGQRFTTNELDIAGTGYILKINDRIPRVLFEINTQNRQIVFAEPIVQFDENTGEILDDLPSIELTVFGVEEVDNILSANRLKNIHAQQVAFGKIPLEQLPSIGHEGRIKESLLPKSYLLERFSNHTFVVPQNNTDNTKTFGDGTTFYCVTDSNGLIDTIANFDEFEDGIQACFRDPTFSANTSDNIDSNYDLSEVSSDPGGFQSEKSCHLQFKFIDSSETRWVQISTFDTENTPNPVIDLKKRLRFRILLTSGSLYLTLGVREISQTSIDVSSNGGTSGPIEWIGATDIILDDNENAVPIGRLISASPDWQEIEFDLAKEQATSFENGDNILTAKYGTLEHFAFTIDPSSDDPAGPFDVYVDKIEQYDDVLVAGTSQGILLSQDFGSSWFLSRLTETPVHKFYKGINNKYLWAVSASQVFIATDPANWFATTGMSGVQYTRDITEDADGNMYVSTDRGVYWFETAIIRNFSSWRQTQPVNAFTTDCYALYHNYISSGADEIWVSTEIGIYKTLNRGQSWSDSGLDTAGLPAFRIINIGSETRSLIAATKKHVLRLLSDNINFITIANLEEQHNLTKIWTFEFFNNRIYVSTEDGIYINTHDDLLSDQTLILEFDKIFPQLDYGPVPGIVFGLNRVVAGSEDKLFLGQENRLQVADINHIVSIKKEYNKEIPSFFIDNKETTIGYIYNSFNNVLIFREPQKVNQIVSASYLPRKKYIAQFNGWAQTNIEADIFLYVNGLPKWLDFSLNTESILTELQETKDALSNVDGKLTDFNSLVPQSQQFLQSTLDAISQIQTGGDDGAPLINRETISNFLAQYTRFVSLVTEDALSELGITSTPKLDLIGFPRQNREPNSRSEIFETNEDFIANDSTGIIINTENGEIDFQIVFTTSTDISRRAEFIFSKYDRLYISVFNSNVNNTGELTHNDLENIMEDTNSGLPSRIVQCQSSNLIKMGIFLERLNPALFNRFNVSQIQSRYYSANTNAWYDIANSTIDFETIIEVENTSESHYCNTLITITSDPYYGNILLCGTDNGISVFQITNDTLVNIDFWQPRNESIIHDIVIDETGTIYTVLENNEESFIYKSMDFGTTWTELETVNLPQYIYKFAKINETSVVATEQGLYYSDNNFGTWYPCDVSLALSNGNQDALTSFRTRCLNLTQNNFLVAELNRWFYFSSSGIEWIGLGNKMALNGVNVINKILRFKNITWIATNKGLYNDANSILSDNMQFGLQSEMDNDAVDLHVSDIVAGSSAIYACSNSVVYRLLDEEWRSYETEGVDIIHKMAILEESETQLLFIVSYSKIKIIDVTLSSGVFG